MNPESSSLDAQPGIEDGAYLLDGVIRTAEGKTSKLLRDQMKIFAKNRFMFAFFDDQTNLIDAATGYAHWVDGVLTETPIANQDGTVEGLSFEIAMKSSANGFTQIVRDMPAVNGGTYDLDEVWNTLSNAQTAFDGLWQLQSRHVEGALCSDFNEMKLIGGGHFIFFQRFDSEGETIKHFGFGALQVEKSGMVIETAMTSTLDSYSGKNHLLNITLIDTDHMTQTFMLNGAEVVQSYVRI